MSAWTSEGQSAALGDTTVTLVEGGSSCVCARNGDILQGGAQGVYHADTRLLSRRELWVDELLLEGLRVLSGEPYHATFLGRAGPGRARGGPGAASWRSGTATSAAACVRTWFDPSMSDGYLRLFPAGLEGLRIEGLSLAGSNVAIEVGVTGTRVRGLPEGIPLIEEPRGPPAGAMWPVH